jgi:peptidoglycan/xylan/chitin deacetylase (PgdA/CDA1 family)
MYHRVAIQERDPWALCVQPKNFEAHLQQVAHLAVGLDQVLQTLPPRRFVLLTFDDGYRDNLECALPLLEIYQVPALVFVTTGSGSNFWWEHLAAQNLDVPEFQRRYQELKRSGRPQVEQAQRLTPTRMTEDEWCQLAASPLVELGAHTVNHPFLPALSNDVQRQEILSSRERLARIAGAPVRSFAYPFGAYETQTTELVAQEGFEVAFTTNPGLWQSTSHRMRLPRVMVKDLSGAEFSALLTKWL